MAKKKKSKKKRTYASGRHSHAWSGPNSSTTQAPNPRQNVQDTPTASDRKRRKSSKGKEKSAGRTPDEIANDIKDSKTRNIFNFMAKRVANGAVKLGDWFGWIEKQGFTNLFFEMLDALGYFEGVTSRVTIEEPEEEVGLLEEAIPMLLGP